MQLFPGIDFVLNIRPFLQDGSGLLRIIPKAFLGCNPFDFTQAFLFASQVKDTPSAGRVSGRILLLSLLNRMT
jgi:hypothetical protein